MTFLILKKIILVCQRLKINPQKAAGNLLNKMWIPKDEIIEQINAHLVKFYGYFVIGIQLRYYFISDPTDTYTFIKCSLDIERNLTAETSSELFDKDFKIKYKGIKWFVASDEAKILERLAGEYPDKIILSSGKLGHVNFDHTAYPRTIIDVELLSKCNELIITGGSTFGFVAALKSLKLPYLVYKNWNNSFCAKSSMSQLV